MINFQKACGLCSLIILINQNIVVADNKRESYQPPSTSTSRITIETNTSGGGSRNDCGNSEINITPMLEQGFLFQVNQIPVPPLQFTLTKPNIPEPLYEIEIPIENKGIIKIQLPDNLERNEDYIWTIAMYCEISPQWYLRGLLRLN
jgi:hypothetical protein